MGSNIIDIENLVASTNRELERKVNSGYNFKNNSQNLAIVSRLELDWNFQIQEYIKRYEELSKNILMETFDYNSYYESLVQPLTLKEYVPLKEPNEKIIRKQVGCLKENKILDFFDKSRENKRLQKEKEFEKKWSDIKKEYNQREKEHIIEYEKYKKDAIKRNVEINKKKYKKKELFNNRDNEEITEILKKYVINWSEIQKHSNIDIFYNYGKCIINIEVNDTELINHIKGVKFVKNVQQFRIIYFNEKEFESFYESIIFNTALYCAAKTMYYINDKIDSVIINIYINKINPAIGQKEKYFIFSALLEKDDIPFERLNLIDSKSFFDTKKARYKLPLSNINKIIPYSSSKKDYFEIINNDLNGFEFEKLSKVLLEKNGFYNVEVTKASGDYGADVIAYKDRVKYAIQCKKYSSSVGVKAIQEIIASKSMYNCHVGVVLTNNYYTSSAIKLAEVNNIILWNKDDLEIMINNADLENNKNQPIRKIDFNELEENELK